MEHPNEIILTDETYPWMPTASRMVNVLALSAEYFRTWHKKGR